MCCPSRRDYRRWGRDQNPDFHSGSLEDVRGSSSRQQRKLRGCQECWGGGVVLRASRLLAKGALCTQRSGVRGLHGRGPCHCQRECVAGPAGAPGHWVSSPTSALVPPGTFVHLSGRPGSGALGGVPRTPGDQERSHTHTPLSCHSPLEQVQEGGFAHVVSASCHVKRLRATSPAGRSPGSPQVISIPTPVCQKFALSPCSIPPSLTLSSHL